MQNVSSDSINNNSEKKGIIILDLEPSKVSTPNSCSPIKSEFNSSYAEIQSGFLSDTSESEEDEISEVEPFAIDQDDLGDEVEMESSKFLIPSDEEPDHSVDPETQARLEALLEAAGIGKIAAGEGKLADPEVLRRLTSSVSCALDEAAAALTRMRNENPRPQNERSLVQACSDGDVKTVKKLLTEGRSVHETTDEGESLLSLACSAGYYELAQVLLAMNANVEDRGIKGDCTPLMEAASSGYVEIVRLLLNHGADVNGQSSSGNTPLMYACAGGHEDVVRLLLECGGNVEDHNENGHTPLMEAASSGHVGVAKILLEFGAGINTHSNEFKESALTLACYKGHLDMVRFLLAAGADQEHKTDEMHTALMEASMDGHVAVARLLLDSGAQVNMPTDSFESPLTLAACGGHVELAILLLERGANIEEVNDEGYTPLMEAAREGHDDMVIVLFTKGAKINAYTDETQETALTLACCGGFLQVADFLLKNGADLELGASTPLMEAAQEGHLELVRYLLDYGAKVHAKTATGDTALTYACENGHTDVADLLLTYGADLEHESEGGRTPLMKACRAGHLCTIQFLISKDADINRPTSNNDHTPLSLACAGGHLNVVQLLLAHNADPYYKLKDNSTMLIEAAKGGHTKVVQLLLDYPQSVIGGSIPSPSDSSSQLCSQADSDVLSVKQREEIINEVFGNSSSKDQTPSNSLPGTMSESSTPPCLTPCIPANNPVGPSDALNDASVREIISIKQMTKLLQKQKLQSQELQHKIGLHLKNKALQQDSCGSKMSPSSSSSPSPSPSSSSSSSVGEMKKISKQLPSPPLQNQQQKEQPSNKQLSSDANVESKHLQKLSNVDAQLQKLSTSIKALSNGPSIELYETDANPNETQSNKNSSTSGNSKETQKSKRDTTNTLKSPVILQNTPPVQQNPISASSENISHFQVFDDVTENVKSNIVSSTTKSTRKIRSFQVPPEQMEVLTPDQAKELLQKIPLTLGLDEEASDTTKQNFFQGLVNNPLSSFYQYPFLRENSKKIKEKGQTLDQNDYSNVSPVIMSLSPPSSPPSELLLRPVTPPTPPSWYGEDGLPTKTAVSQGVVVNHQPLFHPGANTTVLHNTIYTRSVPVPSPADVNQSTAICDRPKAKPVSKKDGKNVKKQQLAAYHYAIQQQKEALQLKQLVEMNEQLVNQVVSQQQSPQSVDSDSVSHTSITSDTILSSDILSDNIINTRTSDNTMLSNDIMAACMKGGVDIDLRDHIESFRLEEEMNLINSNDGNKKLLQDKLQHYGDKFHHYAAGFHDGLKIITAANPTVISEQTRLRNAIRNAVAANAESSSTTPTTIEVVPGSGNEPFHLFTTPTVQVQQNPHGIQLQYRKDLFTKMDPTSAACSTNPTVSIKNGTSNSCDSSTTTTITTASPVVTIPANTSKTTTTIATSPPSNHIQVATQTPNVVHSPPRGRRYSTTIVNTGAKAVKKRDLRYNNNIVTSTTSNSSVCQPASASTTTTVDPNQPRFPSASESPSPASVTTSGSYAGMDVDSETESNHDTALTLACAGGHEELVELLLSRGADIEHRDKKGFTPLILAATAGHEKVVEILLNHQADMEAQSERTKDTPLSLACSGGRYEVVELLLTRGANKEHRNVSDYTPLSLAASGGYVNIIKLLLTHGAEINSRTGSKLGISPLMLAAMNGHTAAVKLLLDMGSDINAQIETNRNTALTLACFQGRHEVVSLLLDRKANVEHRAKTGLTPLMEAASGGYVEVGRVLLDKGADVNAPPVPSSRDTALTIASDKGHGRFAELLLHRNAQVEVKNKKGNSPLWLAANSGHSSVVELLLKHGADIDSQDNRQVSCLMAAFRKGHVKVVKWMVNHVAQFPSDQEMTRYIQTVNDKELLDKCQECSMVIRVAKNQQAEKANKNANILLEELDMEKWREESKRAAQARKRERKKQKKLEKKEVKRKQNKDDDEEEMDEDDDDKENQEEDEEEEEEVINISTTNKEGEEGDSGIDANSQASCSSNEVKQQASNKKKGKDKKKKKSASTSNVPTVVTSNNNNKTNEVKKNASTNAVPNVLTTAKQQPNVESNNSKKDKKKLSNSENNLNTSSNNNSQQKTLNSHPASNVNSSSSKSKSVKTVTPQVEIPSSTPKTVSSSTSVSVNNTNVISKDSKKTKEIKVTTPRKEIQQQPLIFESSRHPAERDDFEATGNDSNKDRKRTSLMSLYSDGELVASSSGAKINNQKQSSGKREEGWQEVVRKYLNTPFRSKKVSVPLNAISRVIGRGGSNINAIRSATSAHIEVEKQCKGQGERIITIKGNNESINKAHLLINALIKDPDVDITKLLAENGVNPTLTPPVFTTTPVKPKTQVISLPSITSTSSSSIASLKQAVSQVNSSVSSSSSLLGTVPMSMTFVKTPSTSQQVVPQSSLPSPSTVIPTPLMPAGMRPSAPRATVPRIVAAAGEKRAPAPRPMAAASSSTHSTMSYTSVIMTKAPSSSLSSSSSFAAKLTEPSLSTSSSPPLQPRPLPTASAPPSISAPFQNPPAPSPTAQLNGLPPQQIQPTVAQGLTEYSLFNDTFTKVTQQSVWGRDDSNNGDKNQKGMNFASVAANNSGTVTPPNAATKYLDPTPPVDAAKAPGYRGTSVPSPVMAKPNVIMSSATSPSISIYQHNMVAVNTSPPLNSAVTRPRPTSVYNEDPSPLYQQDLLKMVPGSPYIQTSISMSRLNPRAPDFSSVKVPQLLPQQQSMAPVFNSAVAPPTHIPPPVVAFSNKYQTPQQVPPSNTQTRWNYMHYVNQTQMPQVDSNILFRQLALASNQAGDLFSSAMESTPPNSPLEGLDERKVQPRPIGTERAWNNKYNNVGNMPLVDENMSWLQQDNKSCFGGVGDNRHLFRSTTGVPQFSRLPMAEDISQPLAGAHLVDNTFSDAAGTHFNMNGTAAVMLLPQLENTFEHPQQLSSQTGSFGLANLIPESYKPDNSWDNSRICMPPDVPLSDKHPQAWAKWSN